MAEARGRARRPRFLPPPVPVLRYDLAGAGRRGGMHHGGNVTPFKFIGPVPESIDPPEAFGWSFSAAKVVFTQKALHEELKALNRDRHPDDGIILPRQPLILPPVHEVWWDQSDIHAPYLLWSLLRGETRAFGDPQRAGTAPEWIPQRLWLDLKPSPSNNRLFEGAGNVFWNVRVVAASTFAASVAPTTPPADSRQAKRTGESAFSQCNAGPPPNRNSRTSNKQAPDAWRDDASSRYR